MIIRVDNKVHLVPMGEIPGTVQNHIKSRLTSSTQYNTMLSELSQDPERNALIAQDVASEAGNGGGVCLVLSDRKAHCKALADILTHRGVQVAILTGNLSNGERQKIVADLNAGRIKVLVASVQLIGEGFDCPHLSTLFLATCGGAQVALQQRLILRPGNKKFIKI